MQFQRVSRRDRKAAELLENWPQDVLRHSYANYQVGLYEEMQKTAPQMGHTNLKTLEGHYLNQVPKAIRSSHWFPKREAAEG